MEATLAKLQALKGRVISSRELHWNVLEEHFMSMRDQFMTECKKVMQAHSEVADFQPQNYDRHLFKDGERSLYRKPASTELAQDISFFIEFLSNLKGVQLPTLEVSEEGIYLAGQHFDALLRINELVTKATTEIVLVDNYVDGKLLDLLGNKGTGVKCRLLTRPASLSPALKVLITAFNGQHRDLEVRSTAAFHDRFLVLDGKGFYHFGASLKDAGKKGFMFSRIEQASATKALWTEFEAEWAASGPSVV